MAKVFGTHIEIMFFDFISLQVLSQFRPFPNPKQFFALTTLTDRQNTTLYWGVEGEVNSDLIN